MPKTVKVSRAPQAREKYVKVSRGAKNPAPGVPSGTRLFVHSSAMAISSAMCRRVPRRVRGGACS